MFAELILPIAIVAILLIAFGILVYLITKNPHGLKPKAPDPSKVLSAKPKTKVWLGSSQAAANGSFRVERRAPEVVKNKPMGRPKIWLDECTERSTAATCLHQDAWVHYLRWCHEERRQHLPRQKFLAILAKEVPLVPGERAFAGLRLLAEAPA